MVDLTINEWQRLLTDLNIQYSPNLGKNNRIKCFCPFHEDSEPSFYVHKKWYLCYGISCQKKGDVFELIKELKFKDIDTDFMDIVNYLKKFVSLEKLNKYTKYRKRRKKQNLIFEDWVKTNEDVALEDCSFLLSIKEHIKKIKLVKNKNWDIVLSCINVYDYTDRIYKGELLLIEFARLGYYVYSKGGKLVSKIMPSKELHVFEHYEASLRLSGNQLSNLSKDKTRVTPKGITEFIKERTEFKVITCTFFTENPVYYLNLKNINNISIGIINSESILNFQGAHLIFCFLLLDDGYTTVKDRFSQLFDFHKDNNIKWFYKKIPITEHNYEARVRRFLEINL